MSDQQHGPRKKFLYSDSKKSQEEEAMQFHSRGYHPLGESNKLIDLEKVWSVKDLILDTNGYKPIANDVVANASSTYYSRHGQYKNLKDSDKSGTSVSSPSTWNRKNEINTKKTDNDSGSPFDF